MVEGQQYDKQNLRGTGFEMDMFVLVAVKASSGVDEDCRDPLLF